MALVVTFNSREEFLLKFYIIVAAAELIFSLTEQKELDS